MVEDVRSIDITHEVMIKATPNRVYNAITNKIAAWWGTPYLYTRLAKDIVLEPKLGGRFYEVWGTGQGRLWGTVTQIKKNEWIEITGNLGMKGAVQGTICFALEAKDGATLLTLTHHAIGQISEETESGYVVGWKDLLGTRLKAFVEAGKKYGVGLDPPPGLHSN
jgi:uncharacterized protein YndB with AHSA1/START domain